MANTTTWGAIRRNYTGIIEALTPSMSPTERSFRRGQQGALLRNWAPKTGDPFRRFEFRITGPAAEPLPYFDWNVILRREEVALVVAYPADVALYGNQDVSGAAKSVDFDAMETVMRGDARQLRDTLYSGTNYLAGQLLAEPTIQAPDRSHPGLWFQIISLAVEYYEAQSL